jgi:hypothetical protein
MAWNASSSETGGSNQSIVKEVLLISKEKFKQTMYGETAFN